MQRFRLTHPVAPEDELHQSVFDALRVLLPGDAIINTWELRNARDAVEGARRKRLGALPGWPDMGVFHAGRLVMLELKREGGVLSEAQRLLHPLLDAQGFPVTVCRGRLAVDQALEALAGAGIRVRGKASI